MVSEHPLPHSSSTVKRSSNKSKARTLGTADDDDDDKHPNFSQPCLKGSQCYRSTLSKYTLSMQSFVQSHANTPENAASCTYRSSLVARGESHWHMSASVCSLRPLYHYAKCKTAFTLDFQSVLLSRNIFVQAMVPHSQTVLTMTDSEA